MTPGGLVNINGPITSQLWLTSLSLGLVFLMEKDLHHNSTYKILLVSPDWEASFFSLYFSVM